MRRAGCGLARRILAARTRAVCRGGDEPAAAGRSPTTGGAVSAAHAAAVRGHCCCRCARVTRCSVGTRRAPAGGATAWARADADIDACACASACTCTNARVSRNACACSRTSARVCRNAWACTTTCAGACSSVTASAEAVCGAAGYSCCNSRARDRVRACGQRIRAVIGLAGARRDDRCRRRRFR